MVSQQRLIEFARSLPEGLPFTPILEGKKPDHSYEPHPGKAHRGILDMEAAVRQGHTDYTAVGLWCNPVGRLVILDVDANLEAVMAEHGDDLALAPTITSPKKSAGKFIFRLADDVDETKLHGVSLAASGRGFEVLWGPGRQGVVYGAYPVNEHAPDGGEYTLSGDLGNIPPAPAWMLHLMLRAREEEVSSGGVLAKQLRYGGIKRPLEHTRKVITGCLSVLSPDCEYSTWIAIGMAIHASMPGEEGRRFWTEWSRQSTTHAAAWENEGDPCAEKWDTFRRGKTSIATLIWLADEIDRDRERFDSETRQKMAEDEAADRDTFADLMMKLDAVFNITNPAEAEYEMQKLREQFPRAERSFLDGLYVTHMQHNKRQPVMSIQDVLNLEGVVDYVVPDILYSPSLVIIHAAPGDGKTQAMLAFAKVVARSTPTMIRGEKLPVKGGPVLIAQNDQNNLTLQTMVEDHGFQADDDIRIVNGFNIRDRAGVLRLLNEYKPRLFCIDSLSACSIGSAHSENAKEFADPLYFLSQANGDIFPPCCIFVIHHSNKNGGHRGTSAITAAVDEVMKMRLPTDAEELTYGADLRVINFEKSRSGKGGQQLLMHQLDDLSFCITEPSVDPVNLRGKANTLESKLLYGLRRVYPGTLVTGELAQVGGCTETTARKILGRMAKKGLAEKTTHDYRTAKDGKTRATSCWVAVLSEGILDLVAENIPIEEAGNDPPPDEEE